MPNDGYMTCPKLHSQQVGELCVYLTAKAQPFLIYNYRRILEFQGLPQSSFPIVPNGETRSLRQMLLETVWKKKKAE